MSRQMTDYARDANNDLLIQNGDIVRAECTIKHQEDLLLSDKGDYKENPTICTGAFSYLDDENIQDLIRAASIEFTRDGMQVDGITLLPNGIINTNASYS
jgi:hypothetical protein